MNAGDRLLEELQTFGGKVARHLRYASDVTARMGEALNHPGLDGVASVHDQNRYGRRALRGRECGGISARDEEIDLIGDHSIHGFRKLLEPPLRRKSVEDDVLAFDVTATRESVSEARREDARTGRPNVHESDAKNFCWRLRGRARTKGKRRQGRQGPSGEHRSPISQWLLGQQ